jgi:hypothetical protein
MYKLGDCVRTINGHMGIITKIYKVTGAGLYCHVRETDGCVYYCSLDYLEGKI